jgi:putative hydrolase of the HAD superfamily
MKYRHLFFDLDHTLWDFDANARLTLEELYHGLQLNQRGIDDFDRFHTSYLVHNEKLWARYRNGYIRVDELRWKRMWHTLLDFKIGDEKLARELGNLFLESLPKRTLLFPEALETLQILTDRGFDIHIITNGFELTQHQKLKHSGLHKFFKQVITSERSNSIKPKKEIFDFALSVSGATASESIMIGDSIEVDIIGAMNAGMDQIFVNHTCSECNVKPTFIVQSLGEIPKLL